MIQYYFPPVGGIASLRALRFARRLPELGWEPIVVTPNPAHHHVDSQAAPKARVVRTRSLQFRSGASSVAQTVNEHAQRQSSSSLLASLRELGRRWFYFPDGQIGWYPYAVGASRRLLRSERADAVFSSAYPLSAHLIGRRLASIAGVPWVADYRDLWTEWNYHPGLRHRLDKALERSLISRAQATVTVSPTYAGVLSERGARLATVITNSFDEEDFASPPAETDPVVSYLGTYYHLPYQDLRSALRGIEQFARTGAPRGFRLRFIGDLPLPLLPLIRELKLDPIVEATGFLRHAEAMTHLMRSRVALLAGPPSCDTLALRGNVAAKIFEYLGSRRPILLVGHQDSDVARFLSGFGRARVVPTEDHRGVQQALSELFQQGPVSEEPSLAPFTSRTAAKRLAELLDRVCH
jgi:glycosyltransferase involved in cell wall biosynthesis